MSKKARRKINLALQGGGSHGAVTWGVIDRLLEDERIDVGAISGASAGAVTAAALAYSLHLGGASAARNASTTPAADRWCTRVRVDSSVSS